MPGNTVFEGVEVWQWEYNEFPGRWMIDTKERCDYFHNKYGCQIQHCYQPLEFQEQVREEADITVTVNADGTHNITIHKETIGTPEAKGIEESVEDILNQVSKELVSVGFKTAVDQYGYPTLHEIAINAITKAVQQRNKEIVKLIEAEILLTNKEIEIGLSQHNNVSYLRYEIKVYERLLSTINKTP